MSNTSPEQERAALMEAARSEPKILDDKELSLSDIAKLAGIKEYIEEPKVSPKAEQLVESITAEPKTESSISKAIKESDADDSLATNIKKAVTEESKRLDKIAELEAQLAELKTEQKEEQTYDAKSFREVVAKDMQEYITNANENELVELYNAVSDNEAVYNEESSNILVKTPETTQIIADAEKAEQPEEEVVAEKEKDDEDEDDNEDEDDEAGEVPMLDKEFDEEVPAEDKYTNDLDPQK
jgi:N-acetylmuramoyl-L-alanine amidase CwlA